MTGFGPRDLFDWVYAILHSPAYRARYADFLKSDFARVPLPPSAVLFRELARLGGQLVELHLLESKALASGGPEYEGSRRPEVGRVGWADDTVWIDAARTQASAGHRAAKAGSAGFHGVREEAWDFHIGGYQVLHKWLKDRQGRTLSAADIEHYRKMVVAITETIRLMREIDEVIAAHGGWPGAFKTEARP